MTTLTASTFHVRCQCGRFYRVQEFGGSLSLMDITRRTDPKHDVGAHPCPDNRIPTTEAAQR